MCLSSVCVLAVAYATDGQEGALKHYVSNVVVSCPCPYATNALCLDLVESLCLSRVCRSTFILRVRGGVNLVTEWGQAQEGIPEADSLTGAQAVWILQWLMLGRALPVTAEGQLEPLHVSRYASDVDEVERFYAAVVNVEVRVDLGVVDRPVAVVAHAAANALVFKSWTVWTLPLR